MSYPKHLCGWNGDGGHKVFAAQFPDFRTYASHLMGAAPGSEPKLLYPAFTDVLGKYPNYPAQQIGDCVSFGHGHANDLLQCLEIRLGESIDYRETDTEFIYGASRQVAGMLGRNDGSYGGAAVKAMTTFGMVDREMLGADGIYSGERAKQWGRVGPPRDVEEKAASYKLGSAALVSTWAELVAAIANGYPATICTAQGFSLTRDSQGFCEAKGTWGHCMFVAGVRFDRPGACIVQSWGPNVPAGPLALSQPDYSFWAEQQVVESILAEGDSFALSKTPGFVQRQLPAHWKYHDLG